MIAAELLKLTPHVNHNVPDSIDCKLWIILGKDLFPKFLMQDNYVGWNYVCEFACFFNLIVSLKI